MRVHKAIVGATLGGLLTVVGIVLGYHVIIKGHSFHGSERLIYASLIQVGVMAAIMRMIGRPRRPRPLTWSRAMLGAVAVSGLSLLALGAVPNEFLNFAGSELHWDRRDLVMIDLPSLIPFDISRQAIRDIVVAGLYTNSFAAALAMWLMWQRRDEMAEERVATKEGAGEEPVAVPAGTSAYGRPLSKQTQA